MKVGAAALADFNRSSADVLLSPVVAAASCAVVTFRQLTRHAAPDHLLPSVPLPSQAATCPLLLQVLLLNSKTKTRRRMRSSRRWW